MVTTLFIDFSDTQGQLTLWSVMASGWNSNIQPFMVILITCKNKEDPSKNEGSRVAKHFSNYKSVGIFPDALGQLTPQPEV